jgi:acetyl esterase
MARQPENLKGKKFNLLRRDGGQVEVLYYQSNRPAAPLLLEAHGGGFITGHHWSDDILCAELNQRLDINVASVEYRYAPKVHYPKATEDAQDALLALIDDPSFDFDRRNVFLIGHSAGGNIVAGLCLLDQGEHDFRGLILDYPFLDCWIKPKDRPRIKYSLPGVLLDYFVKRYFPDKTRLREPLASPALAPDDLLAKLPPTLIITCGYDSLKIDGALMHQRLLANGIEARLVNYEKAWHGFIETVPSGTLDRIRFIPKADRLRMKDLYQQAVDEICKFVESKTIHP